jgi:hypothetical protein
LAHGAPAFGCMGDVWTTKRIAAISTARCGVAYHLAQVRRLVRAWGQRVPFPVTQATHRDAAALQAWQNTRWPERTKRRQPQDEPVAGSMQPAVTCCQRVSARTPHAVAHQCCGVR